MNLYDLLHKPEETSSYSKAQESVPEIVWEKNKLFPKKLLKKRAVLAKDPKTAFMFANLLLHGEFPEGEDAIATSPEYSYEYSFVIGHRFRKGEPAIAKDPEYAIRYMKAFLYGKKFPEAEKEMAKTPGHALQYAKISGERFKKGEPAVLTDPGYSLLYARNVIKGRWPEGEKTINEDPAIAKLYREFLFPVK